MAGYKLATYQTSDGPRAGLVIDDKVFDAAKLTGKGAYATVLGILEDWKASCAKRWRRPEKAASKRCRSDAPSCWRPCAGRRRSTAPAPIMPTTPPKWLGA